MLIPGHIDDRDAVRALQQQTSRENSGALVVKKILVPLALYEFRQQHRSDFVRPSDLTERAACNSGSRMYYTSPLSLPHLTRLC